MSLHKQLTEKELLEGFKQGNHDSFEPLYKLYYSRLCSYAKVFVKSKELAEEIVQETFLRIWENREDINIHFSFKAYIYKCVYHHCLIFIRKKDNLRIKYEKMAEEIIYNYEMATASLDPDFNTITFESDQEVKLNCILQSLPNQCKQIFYKSRFESMTYKEIAEEMDLSVNTIKTQMKRALSKLRQYLQQEIKEEASRV